MKLYIKNMVCDRCIAAVDEIIRATGLSASAVRLGEVDLADALTDDQQSMIRQRLRARGFDLISDRKQQLINQIKAIILQHFQEETTVPINFSDLLAGELHYEYTYLSKLFSRSEGRSIEQFITAHRMERAREYLSYGELSISEIAERLHYGSLAHFSSQFRKEVGVSPTAYQRQSPADRKPLDKI